LGAITTIAVAWGLAAFLPHRNGAWRYWGIEIAEGTGGKPYPLAIPSHDEWRSVSMDEYVRPGMIRRYWFLHPAMGEIYDGPVPLYGLESQTVIRGDAPIWGDLPRAMLDTSVIRQESWEDARGWPWLALWCSMKGSGWLTWGGLPISAQGAIELGPTQADFAQFRALPLRPLWRGFLLDSLVFGAAWFLIMPITRILARNIRAVLRRSRGRCGACGYDLTGLAEGTVCPECGAQNGAR
jgi:hypothetical protein